MTLYCKDICEKCDNQGVYSCQPFPCEHGGHTCELCDGNGWKFVPVVLDRLTQHSGYLDHLIRYFGPCGASCDSEINQHDEVCVTAGILTDMKWLIGDNE